MTTTKAELAPTAKAFTVGGGSVSGRNVTFNSRVNVDASGTPIAPTYTYNTVIGNGQTATVAPAFARVTLGNIALGFGVSGGLVTVIDSPVVETTVASGTQITATGAVTVRSQSFGDSQSDGQAVAGGLAAGIGVVITSTTSGGSVATTFNGTVLSAGSVTIRSDVSAKATGDGRAFSGSLGVAVNVASISVTVNPSVTTTVGGSITSTGDVTIAASTLTSVLGDYRGIQFAGLASVGIETVTALDDTTTTTTVTGSAKSNSGKLGVYAFHNFDGTGFVSANDVQASASVVTAAIGLAMGSSNLTATASAYTEATLAATGTLAAPNLAVEVKALAGNYARATMKNISGGIINLGSLDSNPTADASGETYAKLLGHVRVVVSGNDTAGASSITVLAQAEDQATATMTNAGGGAISIANSNSTAQGTPIVGVTLGSSGSVAIATNNFTAQAISVYDADSSTSSATGGALNVAGFTANANISPTATAALVGGAHITSINGSISIDASANPPLPEASDGHFNAGTGVSDATNTITFTCNGTPCAHNATTGDAVTYQNLGNGTIPGLTNGRTYSVIVTGPNSVQLGGTFTSNDVNTALDVIDFGLRDPHLETGDHVIYFRIGSASTIGGLTNGVEYEVYRVPGTNRIKLRPLGFSSASTSRNAGSVDNGTEFITGAAPFANGDFVTYYAPDPLATFSSVQVGKRFTFSGGDVNGTTASANTIYFTVDSNNNGKLDNGDSIGLSTGDRIFYTASDPLNAIGGLTSGVFYFVIRLDGLDYQLADTKCHATGAAGDCGGSAQPQQVLTLTLSAANQTTAGKQVVHAIRAATNAPIAGLEDGHGYFVVGCTGASGSCNNATGFQLSNSLGGGAINIDNRGVTGGPHLFSREGINLTSTGTGPGSSVAAHELVLNIAPSSGTQRLLGIGDAVPFAASTGDQVVSASATGGGGGLISVSDAKSFSNASTTVSTTINGNATLTAGASISVTTHGNVLGKAVSSNDSGGFISVNSANSHVTVSMTNTVTVANGATLTALGTVAGQGDVTVASHSFLQPVTIASSGSGGLFAGGSGGTFASADFLTKTNMDGTIVAADNANVEAHTDISGAFVQVTADVGGLGVSGTTDADLFVGTTNGLNQVDVQSHADITGNHVLIGAVVDHLAGVLSTRTHATAVGANSQATGTITVGGSTQVKLENGATIVGNVDTSIVAEYADIDLHATADASCSCLGGVTDSTATINAKPMRASRASTARRSRRRTSASP